jgi:dihydroorotase
MQELDVAPFGIIGLETCLPLTITQLIEPGHLTWEQAIRKMTINPAKILGVDKGTLRLGADADVTIIDPKRPWTVDCSEFRSKSKNSPFGGWELTGRAVTTIVGGKIKYQLN